MANFISVIKVFFYIFLVLLIFLVKGEMASRGIYFGFLGWILIFALIFFGYRILVLPEISTSFRYIKYLSSYMKVENKRLIKKAISLAENNQPQKAIEFLKANKSNYDVASKFFIWQLDCIHNKNPKNLENFIGLIEKDKILPFGDLYYLIASCYKKNGDINNFNKYVSLLRTSKMFYFKRENLL